MDCEGVKQVIPAYIKHTAGADEVREVEEHLCICHACREFLGNQMDRPQAPPTIERSKSSDKGVGIFEYAVLGVGRSPSPSIINVTSLSMSQTGRQKF